MPPRHNRGAKNPAAPQTEPKVKAKRIKVRALRTGYYDHARRREGDVFIVDECDLGTWMERVHSSTPESITTAQGAIDKAHDEVLAARAPASGIDQDGL